MGRITAIEVQKKNTDRRSIFIDGQFAAGVGADIVISLGLFVGQEVDDIQLSRILHREDRRRALSSVVNLLGYRDRTGAEVRSRLRSKGYDDELIEDVLDELSRLSLVDDKKFSKNWVENRTRFRPRGKTALMAELRAKGIDKQTAEDALEDMDEQTELELAKRVAETCMGKTTKQREQLTRYVSGVLARRGFDWDTIRRVMEDIVED